MVEVLLVVAVLAIAAAMALPMMGDTNATRLRAAARMLVADLQVVQSESMAHADDPRVLVIDSGNKKYHVATEADVLTPIANPIGGGDYITVFGKSRAAMLDGVSFSSYSFDGDNKLGFGMHGQLDQTVSATIQLGAGGKSLTIAVDPVTGEASIGNIE